MILPFFIEKIDLKNMSAPDVNRVVMDSKPPKLLFSVSEHLRLLGTHLLSIRINTIST